VDGARVDHVDQRPGRRRVQSRLGRRGAARVERHEHATTPRQSMEKLAERKPWSQCRGNACAGRDGEPPGQPVGALVQLGIGERAPLGNHGRMVGAGARRG
jgi:hypothetical protein